MKVSKRQFLKIGLEGSAAIFLGSLLRPASLLASPVVVPAEYLNTLTHGYWMKLSYNQGQESRQTRRCLGAALRNIGVIQGTGNGARFAPWFDQALSLAFRRALATGRRPASVFGLVQMLYDDFIYPRVGVAGGRVMFGTLLGILRGRDGTPQGAGAYESYLAYRQAVLAHKDAYKTAASPQEILDARKKRQTSLALWQRDLRSLVEAYAYQRKALNPTFRIRQEMLEGFDIYVDPTPSTQPIQPRLTFTRAGGRMIISWQGGGTLQQAPSLSGPWRDVAKSSPVTVDVTQPAAFFRAVKQ